MSAKSKKKRTKKLPKMERLEEKIIEITPQQEEEIFCNFYFVNAATTNYRKLVNTPPSKHEIGYLFKEEIRERYIVVDPIEDIQTRRRKKAHWLQEKFDMFIPYWEFENSRMDKKEVGRMLGFRILLR